VPSARGEPAEERALRRLGIQVKRLRIELPCERRDRLIIESCPVAGRLTRDSAVHSGRENP